MVRQFDLPWQPVSKLKNKENEILTSNYQGQSKCLALRVNPEGDTMMDKNEEDNEGNKGSLAGEASKDQTKNRKKLQNLIDDISKVSSGQKI